MIGWKYHLIVATDHQDVLMVQTLIHGGANIHLCDKEGIPH